MSNDMSVPTLSSRAKFSMTIYEMSSRRILLIEANLLVPMPEQVLFLMVIGRICQNYRMYGQQRIEFYDTFSHLTARTSYSPSIKAFSDDLRFNILSLSQQKSLSKISS
jgi:hypothetical protein